MNYHPFPFLIWTFCITCVFFRWISDLWVWCRVILIPRFYSCLTVNLGFSVATIIGWYDVWTVGVVRFSVMSSRLGVDIFGLYCRCFQSLQYGRNSIFTPVVRFQQWFIKNGPYTNWASFWTICTQGAICSWDFYGWRFYIRNFKW